MAELQNSKRFCFIIFFSNFRVEVLWRNFVIQYWHTKYLLTQPSHLRNEFVEVYNFAVFKIFSKIICDALIVNLCHVLPNYICLYIFSRYSLKENFLVECLWCLWDYFVWEWNISKKLVTYSTCVEFYKRRQVFKTLKLYWNGLYEMFGEYLSFL